MKAQIDIIIEKPVIKIKSLTPRYDFGNNRVASKNNNKETEGSKDDKRKML